MSLTRWLVYPFRGQGGWLLWLCAVALYAIAAAFDGSRWNDTLRVLTMLALPFAWIVVFGVFQHYAWASLRHVAAGHDETIRSIEIEEVSPLSNYLAFKVAALLFGLAGLVAGAFSNDPVAGWVVVAVIGVALPSTLGVMILEERFMAGLDPKLVARFVTGLGPAYVVFASLLYAGMTALYVATVAMSPPNIVVVLAAGYVFVLGHVLAGRVVYACRDRLGLSTLPQNDPQHVAAVADAKEIDALMVELHRLCGVDHVDRAGKLLETFLAKSDFALDERIHQRLGVFHDKRLRLEHNWHYLNRLLEANKPLRAWSLVRESLDVDPLFRPASVDVALQLVAAAPATDGGYVDLLLSDVERAYPESERVPEAVFEHARWLVAKLERVDAALARLELIEREYPEWAQDPRFRSFYERVRRLAE